MDQLNCQEQEKPITNNKRLRILVGILVPGAVLGGIVFLMFHRSPFPCWTYELLHIYCPGCGSGRAAYALVHLQFLEAFSYNPLFIIALPFLAYDLGVRYLRFVFGWRRLSPLNLNLPVTVAVMVVIILFGILRNIPVAPFTWLAP